MRRLPPPLSVTRPPPSRTIRALAALRTFAVAAIVITTGSGPQAKVMIPPLPTAATTAAEVQLAGVPLPTVRVGLLVSTARASAGTAAFPCGLPGAGSAFTVVLADGLGATVASPSPALAVGVPGPACHAGSAGS